MSKSFKMKGIEQNNGEVKLYDERVVLFPPNIITLLGSVFGQGSESLLVYLGKKMGRTLVENWEEHVRPDNSKELIESFFEMTSLAGWGEFILKKISDDEIIVQLKKNIAHEEEPALKHICNFILGYIAGFGEFMMYNAKTTEKICSIDNTSSEYCEFIIQKR